MPEPRYRVERVSLLLKLKSTVVGHTAVPSLIIILTPIISLNPLVPLRTHHRCTGSTGHHCRVCVGLLNVAAIQLKLWLELPHLQRWLDTCA